MAFVKSPPYEENTKSSAFNDQGSVPLPGPVASPPQTSGGGGGGGGTRSAGFVS